MAITKIKSSNITDDSITAAKIADGTVVAADIADGTITDAKIGALNANKLTGTIADARVPASAVTQHVTGYDDSTIKSDILKLALSQAVDGNRVAYNLSNSFIDGFEDNTGITTQTNVARNTDGEYVATSITTVGQFSSDANTVLLLHMDDTGLTDSSSNSHTITVGGNAARSNTQSKFGSYSMTCPGGGDDFLTTPSSMYNIGTGDFTVEGWFYWTSFVNNSAMFDWSSWGSNQYDFLVRANADTQASSPNWEVGIYGGGGSYPDRYAHENTTPRVATNTWTHVAVERHSGTFRMYKDGVNKSFTASGNGFTGDYNFVTSGAMRIGKNSWNIHNGYIDEVRFSNVARYQGTNFTPNQVTSANATGTLISDVQTASSSRTSCSGVIIYEDSAGTATLGTDLKIYFTANNGSNWTEAASYATAVTYSGTKKLVTLGSTTVTAGTQIAIKAEWANQANNSKVTFLHGWAVNY